MGASLPLEVTLYFNGFYSALVFIITLLMFIFKAVVLPYPPNVLGLEVAFVFLYGIVEWVRLRQGALLRARALFSMQGFFFRAWPARAPAPARNHRPPPRPPPHAPLPPLPAPRSLARQPLGELGPAAVFPVPQRARCDFPRVLPAAANVRAAPGRGGAGHRARVCGRGGAAAGAGGVRVLGAGGVI